MGQKEEGFAGEAVFMNLKEFSKKFDHTLLKADANESQIRSLCAEALEHDFFSVCVNSTWVPLCSSLLKGSDVLPITVVGFPLGACLTKSKVAEAQQAIEVGAKEIDMVQNIGYLKSGRFTVVEKDIASVVKATGSIPVKVIIETALLTDEEIALSTKLCVNAGAAFVKTSTGFASRGASPQDIAIIQKNISPQTQIKASGGIRDLKTALEYLNMGVHRIGSSTTVQIMKDYAAFLKGHS